MQSAGPPAADGQIKLVLVGDTAVGKSSTLLRYVDDTFSSSSVGLIGVDFRYRVIKIGRKQIKVQIWDTAGQERFHTVTTAYYRGADGIVFIFDITNKDSFRHVNDWLAEVNRYTTDICKRILVGNKSDRDGERAISHEEANVRLASSHMYVYSITIYDQAFAASVNMTYIETSAKSSTNVETAFTLIASEILNTSGTKCDVTGPETVTLIQGDTGRKKQKSCCM